MLSFLTSCILSHVRHKHFYTDLKDPRNLHGDDMLLNGNAPKAGEMMTMPHLAATLKVSYK